MTGEPFLFFTAEDPRELPKGSRDPLRFLPEWTAVGREMIPTLTTVTPSYRGFLTRFLFHGALQAWWPELARASAARQWQAFCRFEQLCAIVRTHSTPSTPHLPGKTGVSDLLDSGRYPIGDASKYWLGRSQRSTGFWGYYHQALIGGEVIEPNDATPSGYQLTDKSKHYWDASRWPALMDSLWQSLEPVIDPKGRAKTTDIDLSDWTSLARAFALKPFAGGDLNDQEFWSARILWPSATEAEARSGREFARALGQIVPTGEKPNFGVIWGSLAHLQHSPRVAQHAQRVCASEAIIGLCEWVFNVCRAANESLPDLRALAAWAEDECGFSDWLRSLLGYGESPRPELSALRHLAISSQEPFLDLAKLLLGRHDGIMRSRKAAPWVVLSGGDRLDVREPTKLEKLPTLESPIIWRYDYFLTAWISAARELGYLPEELA